MFKFSHVVRSISSNSERYIYRNLGTGNFYISPVSPYCKKCKIHYLQKLRKHSFSGREIGLYIGEAFDVDISRQIIIMDDEEFI